MYEIEKEKEN